MRALRVWEHKHDATFMSQLMHGDGASTVTSTAGPGLELDSSLRKRESRLEEPRRVLGSPFRIGPVYTCKRANERREKGSWSRAGIVMYFGGDRTVTRRASESRAASFRLGHGVTVAPKGFAAVRPRLRRSQIWIWSPAGACASKRAPRFGRVAWAAVRAMREAGDTGRRGRPCARHLWYTDDE